MNSEDLRPSLLPPPSKDGFLMQEVHTRSLVEEVCGAKTNGNQHNPNTTVDQETTVHDHDSVQWAQKSKKLITVLENDENTID